jgi:hypothetical protein
MVRPPYLHFLNPRFNLLIFCSRARAIFARSPEKCNLFERKERDDGTYAS